MLYTFALTWHSAWHRGAHSVRVSWMDGRCLEEKNTNPLRAIEGLGSACLSWEREESREG